MKKFDWFTILGMLAIAESTILVIVQGGWFTVAGLVFGGFFALVAHWDWKRYQAIKHDQDLVARDDIQAIARIWRIGGAGITVDEFSSALNNFCSSHHSIGDVGCKWNARSPYLRCTINPSGECEGCRDYEKV